MIECKILGPESGHLWQSYVTARPDCGVYHHWGWKRVVERAYGHSAPYLVATRAGGLSGVLPLVHVSSRLFGSSLTSLPFLDYGGIVADDPESHAALIAACRGLGGDLGVDYIELRSVGSPVDGWETDTQKVLMKMEVASDEERLWSSLPSERRNRVRRAKKSGLDVEFADSGKLDVFYDIWTRNMRDLGSPPHSRDFFAATLQELAENSVLLLVRLQGEYIGAALALFWKETLSVPWVSSLRSHFSVYPNNILYWEALRFAATRGLRVFDFGRSSRDSGTYEFKQRWGATPTQLHWQYDSLGKTGSHKGPRSESYGLAQQVWKRLPVALTRSIGPWLRKGITA